MNALIFLLSPGGVATKVEDLGEADLDLNARCELVEKLMASAHASIKIIEERATVTLRPDYRLTESQRDWIQERLTPKYRVELNNGSYLVEIPARIKGSVSASRILGIV